MTWNNAVRKKKIFKGEGNLNSLISPTTMKTVETSCTLTNWCFKETIVLINFVRAGCADITQCEMKPLSNTVHCVRGQALHIPMTPCPPSDSSWTQTPQRNPPPSWLSTAWDLAPWAMSNNVSKFSSHINRNKAKTKGNQSRKMRSRIQLLKVHGAVMPMKSCDLSFLSGSSES